MNKKELLIALTSLFSVCLIISNVIASKIVSFFVWTVPAAVFVYPLTFLLTDIISEIYGKKEANFCVKVGFFSSLVLVFFVFLAIHLKPAPFYKFDEQFCLILGSSPRIVLASILSFVFSQSLDIFIFHFFKEKTKEKKLWLRNNASTITSQFFDTLIFVSIAFLGVFSFKDLVNILLSQFSFKVVIAFLDTPFFYLATSKLRKQNES